MGRWRFVRSGRVCTRARAGRSGRNRGRSRRLRFGGLISLPVASLVGITFISVIFLGPATAAAQYQAPSQKLVMSARAATTWSNGDTDVAQLEGPVTVELDRATLTGRQAVLWITPE